MPRSPPSTATNNSEDATTKPSVNSDFVVILTALLCALICVLGLVAVARCAWARRRLSANSRLTPPSANKGLKKKVLKSLPKQTFPDGEEGGNLTECAICLTEFVEGDEIRLLPQCGHGFHVGCIDTWLGAHSSCPSCRRLVVRCQKCGEWPPEPAGAQTALPSFLP